MSFCSIDSIECLERERSLVSSLCSPGSWTLALRAAVLRTDVPWVVGCSMLQPLGKGKGPLRPLTRAQRVWVACAGFSNREDEYEFRCL